MPFLTDFNDNPNDNGRGGVLESDLVFYSTRFKESITAPKGTRSNYGNVPWWVPKWLLPRGAQYRAEFFFHDFLYRNKTKYTRTQADLLLRDALAEKGKIITELSRLYGDSFVTRLQKKIGGTIAPWIAWAGVRAGGWAVWQTET